MAPGAEFSFTFNDKGVYNYFCSLHPFMVGQVIVQAEEEVPTYLYLEPLPEQLVVGEAVEFTGYLITADGEHIEGATIEIYAINDEEDTWLIGTATTDSNGAFYTTWTVEALDDYLGIVAYFPGEEELLEAYSEYYIVSITEAEEEVPTKIEINLENDSYFIGDTVLVNVSVEPVVKSEAYVVIFNGDGLIYAEGPIEIEPNGSSNFEFNISGEDATSGTWIIGIVYGNTIQIKEFEVTKAEGDYIILTPYNIEFEDQTFIIYAGLSSGEINKIFVDKEAAMMHIYLDSRFYERELVVVLPRQLIDAKMSIDEDTDFIILDEDNNLVDYVETETTETTRTLHIFIDGNTNHIRIIGTSLYSYEIPEIKTVITLDPPLPEIRADQPVTFTGSIYTINGEPIQGALIYILNDDGGEYADIVAYGLSDSNGKFNIPLALEPSDKDGKLLLYAYFEGGYDLYGSWLTEAFSKQYEVTIIDEQPRYTLSREEELGPYMRLFGVWDHDPIRVAIINPNNQASEEQVRAVKSAFKEWSRVLKETSRNYEAFNFEIVSAKNNRFINEPDIIVEIKFKDRCDGEFGFANLSLNDATRFYKTVPAVVWAGCGDQIYPPEIIRATAIHELAHAFGLGHTFNKDYDLMCSEENGHPTCEFPPPEYDKISDLNINAVLKLYGIDGFGEPNIRQVPYIYAPNAAPNSLYLVLDRIWSIGDTIVVRVVDSNGYLRDIKPSIVGIDTAQITRIGVGTYKIKTQQDTGFTIALGTSRLYIAPSIQSSKTFTIEGFNIPITLTNGVVKSIDINIEDKSLNLELDNIIDDARITIDIPREVLDSNSAGRDIPFNVMTDGKPVECKEDISDNSRVLTCNIPKDAKEIKIIGTHVVTEFGIILLVLAVSIAGILAVSRREYQCY